jgi:hypothetical protein
MSVEFRYGTNTTSWNVRVSVAIGRKAVVGCAARLWPYSTQLSAWHRCAKRSISSSCVAKEVTSRART